jgi:hypothetical protein
LVFKLAWLIFEPLTIFYMAPPFQKKIIIRRTEGEIELIRQRLRDIKRGDINAYLRTETRKLVSTFKDCPNCITSAYGDKKEITYQIDEPEIHKGLAQISFIMQKPISSIIDDFFIAPLLLPKIK